MAKPGSTPTDELVRRAIIGDGAAFTELWDTNIQSLRLYLHSSMKNLDDFYIDDICSRSFEKAFRQIRSYDPTRSQFSTWLKVIAHNTALDIIEMENPKGGAVVIDMGDGMATPLETIIIDEDEEKLRNCIEGLPELYREVARKRLLEGLQYKEIAEELGISRRTVLRNIAAMPDIVRRVGPDKGGHWELSEANNEGVHP